ncbi:MAG: FG-GAP-like repeat-containing protein [Phycisphaerales bacterium]
MKADPRRRGLGRSAPSRAAAFLAASLASVAVAQSKPAAPDATRDLATIARFNEGAGQMGLFAFEDAEKIYAALVAARPQDRDARRNLAIAILNQSVDGAQERALEMLNDLLKDDPNDVRARYSAGLVSLYLGDLEVARRHFEVARQSDPKDAYAAYYVGQSHEYAGEFEQALAAYRAAADLDPYFRSPLLGQQRVLARMGKEAESQQPLDAYMKLDGNPRARIAEFKYTRMGTKSEVVVPGTAAPTPFAGKPPFFVLRPLSVTGPAQWATEGPAPNMTVADIDGDGVLDLFVAHARIDGTNAVLLGSVTDPARFTLQLDHPLAGVSDVRCALWGDFDNDGRTDVYLCRKGPNQLWRNAPDGWHDVTAAAKAAGGDLDTVDGAMADLDHDGDLDLYLVNADGPCELLSNNADGTFRAIGKDSGASGDGRPGRRVVVADFDRDRDADLFLVHDKPPHELLLNDRLWSYRRDEGIGDLATADIDSAAAADRDADGRVDLVTVSSTGRVGEWTRAERAWAARSSVDAGALSADRGGGLAVLDINGSGVPSIVVRTVDGFTALGLDGAVVDKVAVPNPTVRSWAPMTLGTRGPTLVLQSASDLRILAPTPTRGRFAAIALAGRTDPSQAMRSNASGIGARLAMRVADRWSIVEGVRATGGPGQSLQPVAIGLGPSLRADFVAIDWSDGVFQTEVGLSSDAPCPIVETQRQISSCPVIFAWDGARFRFVTDCLGVGGLGYLVGVERRDDGRCAPIYAPPRPWERVLLPESIALAPRDGALELRLAEPMEEALYLDAARLVAYDVPPGLALTIDERMGLCDPSPTGAVRTYSQLIAPVRAMRDGPDGAEVDVLDAVRAVDGVAADPGPIDDRFIGLLREPRTLTLEFAEALDAGGGIPTLVAHGWVEYPYCQTNFAAWQAGRSYDAPDLWARGEDGAWVRVLPSWGYPAGMSREMSLPLVGLPRGTTALRMTTSQEIYWDAVAVARCEPAPQVVRTELSLVAASAQGSGFQQRVPHPQKRADYDYETRRPFWATRHQPGFYTAFGRCDELLSSTDDAVAIIGPGEEIAVRFAVPAPPPPGWTRRYVLEVDGWCKDMDLFTGEGESLAPLPTRDPNGGGSSAREALMRRHQIRWRDGY